MEEELISFETAKLAKEKGFELNSICYYQLYSEGQLRYKLFTEEDENGGYVNEDSLNRIAVVTQTLLQKWLREVHNIEIYVHKFKPNGAYPKGYYCVSRPLIHYSNEMKDWIFTNFKTYEEALEIGLYQALLLI